MFLAARCDIAPKKKFAHLLAGALERARQHVLVDLAHQGLQAGRIELGEILEGEHQGTDALRRFLVRGVERREEADLGLPVEAVEDLGHHLVRVAPARLGQRRDELGAQRVLDMVERFLLHRFQAQHARDDLDREIVRQVAQHVGGVF